jgi:hypothetical protein
VADDAVDDEATIRLGSVVGVTLVFVLVLVLVFSALPRFAEPAVVDVDAGPVVRVVDEGVGCAEVLERLLPMYASAPKNTRAAATSTTAALRRGRWFIESSAIFWARPDRTAGTPPPAGLERYRSMGRASSKIRGASGSGTSSLPQIRTGGTARVGPGPVPGVVPSPSARPSPAGASATWPSAGPPVRSKGLAVDGPTLSDRCSSVPRAEW